MTNKDKKINDKATKVEEVETETEEKISDSESKEKKNHKDSSNKKTEEQKKESEKEDEKPENEEDEDLKTKYLRLMADFQNYKKRSEKERSDVHAYANEKIVTDILEVMDNFERALKHGEQENFKEGIEMIFNQLSDVLEKAGVREIEAEKATFDPNVHNAVMMEDTDKVKSGEVSEVLQKGYTLNGKVIRASMVKVAK